MAPQRRPAGPERNTRSLPTFGPAALTSAVRPKGRHHHHCSLLCHCCGAASALGAHGSVHRDGANRPGHGSRQHPGTRRLKRRLTTKTDSKDKTTCDGTRSQSFQRTFSGEAWAAEPARFTDSAVRRRYSKIIAAIK